jgi:hypothetical protein
MSCGQRPAYKNLYKFCSPELSSPQQGSYNVIMPKQHNSKTIKSIFKELNRLGFEVQQKRSGTYTIVPPDKTLPIYNTHGTESAIHPIRRDFKRLYDIDLSI